VNDGVIFVGGIMAEMNEHRPASLERREYPEQTLAQLKRAGFEGTIADGQLSTGTKFEITFSRKSAVSEGVHILMVYPGVSDLTESERIEAYATMIRFVSKDPSGSEAKPLPAAKADLGLLFAFQHVEKSSMYLSGYTSGFSPH
jgi:hypothetical protein